MVRRLGDSMSEYGTFTLWAWLAIATPAQGTKAKRVAVVREHHVTRDDAKRITDEYRRLNPDYRGDLSGEWVLRDSF